MIVLDLFDSEPNKKKIDESLADQIMAAAKAAGLKGRVAGTPEQERERSAKILAQRAKEREEQAQQVAQANAARLPELRAEYSAMLKKYNSLGGSNWQYADREQNLTDAEREARAMEPALHDLAHIISQAEKASNQLNELSPDLLQRASSAAYKKFDQAGSYSNRLSDQDAQALMKHYKQQSDKFSQGAAAAQQRDDRKKSLAKINPSAAVMRKTGVTAEGKMSEIDAEYKDYQRMSPRDFYNAYRMTKDQWMQKYQSIVKGPVAEQTSLPYPPRSEQLGRANFELLTRFYNKPTSPVLSLNFGKDVVDLDRPAVEAIADYYDNELRTNDARWNFIRIVMSDPTNLRDVLKKLGQEPQRDPQLDMFGLEPELRYQPTGMRRPPVKEAKKKDDDLGPEIKDVALNRAISQAKADFPTAGSGIEALAKDFMRSQDQDQKSFDQLRQAERQQANLLAQINKLDQQQSSDIDELESENSSLARRLQQLQSVNSELEKKISAMAGRKTQPAEKPEVVVPGATVTQPAATPAEPAAKAKSTKKKTAKQKQPQIQRFPGKDQAQDVEYRDTSLPPAQFGQMVKQLAQPDAMSQMAQQLAPQVPASAKTAAIADIDPEDLSQAKQALAKFQAPTSIRQPEAATAESRKSKPKPEVDYDNDYQDMVSRVGQLAKAGPLKTVWDPVKRVYKNVPVKDEPRRN